MSGGELTLIVVFWLALAGVAQTYIGLPIFVWLLRRWWRRDENYQFSSASDDELPFAAVIIPAYNEEACIRQRIENLLDQDYPADKLRILVGSDCSTDRTHEIVREFTDPRVELRVMPDRRGKLGVLDTLAPVAPGEVVVVTDANIHFEREALRQLCAPFREARVGGVSGNVTLRPPEGDAATNKEITYFSFEGWQKVELGRKGSLLGAYGCNYAFRRELFRPFGPKPVHDDVILPLEILAQGYRFVSAPESMSFEDITDQARQEYRRRVRMTGYSLRSIGRGMRLAWRAGAMAWFLFFSYKVLRWLSPYLNVVWMGAAVALAARGASLIYMMAALAGGLGIAVAALGWLTQSLGKPLPVLSSAFYFALMNLAAWEGAFKLKRVKRHWQPRGG